MSLLVAWELDWMTFKGHFLHKLFCDSDFHNFPVALSKESETYYQNLNKNKKKDISNHFIFQIIVFPFL